MEEIKPAGSLNKAAKIISVIFHPVFMPLYGLVLIFSTPTIYSYVSLQAKKLLLLIVLINNVVMPIILFVFLKVRNYVLTWEMESRKERMFPLFFATILYAITTYVILKYPVPVFIKTYFVGIFFVAATLTVINNWWKISIHAAASGAITALMLMLSFRMYHITILPLAATIAVAGLILSSRLRLNFHSPAQVWFGFLLGFMMLGFLYRVYSIAQW